MNRYLLVLGLFFAPILRGAIFAQRVVTARQIMKDSVVTYAVDTALWQLVESDNFDADSLDWSVWMPQENEERDGLCFMTKRRKNVQLQNGHLDMTAFRENYGSKAYTSGAVIYKTSLKPNVFIETSLKLPKGKGFWPAFWLWSGFDSTYQEVDIVEYRGSKTYKFDISNHYWDAQKRERDHVCTQFYPLTTKGKDRDLSAEFNIYALEWTDDYLKVYMNHQLIYENRQHVPKLPMSLILGMGVGGIDGNPRRRTVFPATMSIDYVRIYTLKNGK